MTLKIFEGHEGSLQNIQNLEVGMQKVDKTLQTLVQNFNDLQNQMNYQGEFIKIIQEKIEGNMEDLKKNLSNFQNLNDSKAPTKTLEEPHDQF